MSFPGLRVFIIWVSILVSIIEYGCNYHRLLMTAWISRVCPAKNVVVGVLILLSQSLDNLGTTRGECLGRTRWSSPLDWTTYLYYFTSGCTLLVHDHMSFLECSTITWPCHVIWLHKFPCYLYLVLIVWLDICNQVFERMGNFLLLGALITHLLCHPMRGICWHLFWGEVH